MFLDLLEARQTGWERERPVWTTLSRLRYRCTFLEAVLEIPSEFVTDLASVPRLPLAWLVAGGRGTRSAVIHDFAYQFGFWLLTDGTKQAIIRQQADEAFYESLRCDPLSGANKVTAWLMYRAVRFGGRGVWNRRLDRTAALNPEWTKSLGVVPPAEAP
jgi:hypothetical protein